MIAMLLWFAAAPPVLARAPAGPVRDAAGLFSPDAARVASARIAELKAKYGYGLIVETVDEQPPLTDIAGVLYRGVRSGRLRTWVRGRALASDLEKGLYVVVSKYPLDVRLVAWPAEQERRFSWWRREEVRAGMRRYLHDNPDRALGEVVDRFGALIASGSDAPTPLATVGLLTLVGGLAGAWLVLCVVRRRVFGMTEPLYPPAVQGGLFGTPAASWIYDRLLQGEKEATTG